MVDSLVLTLIKMSSFFREVTTIRIVIRDVAREIPWLYQTYYVILLHIRFMAPAEKNHIPETRCTWNAPMHPFVLNLLTFSPINI